MNLKPYPKYKDSGIEWLGEIPEGWEVKKLKYVAHVEMGQSPDSDYYNKDGEGVPFLQGNADFKEIYPEPQVWTTEGNKYSQKNDILISVRAPVGEINISDDRYAIGRGLGALRFCEKSNFKFYYYLFNKAKNYFDSVSTGTTYTSVSTDDIKNISVVVPPKEHQTTIANFLDQKTAGIDDLIKKNEKLIELLKEKRQAVISHAVTKGIPPRPPLEKGGWGDLKMKDSGVEWIGKIPEGWETFPIKQIVRNKIIKGIGKNLPLLSLEHIVSGEGRLVDEYISEIVSADEHATFEHGDVLFGKLRPYLKKYYRVNFDGCCPTELMVFYPNKNMLEKDYLFYLVQSNYFVSLADATSYGVKMPRTSWEAISSHYIPIPKISEQHGIFEFLENIFEKINVTIKKIQSQIGKLKEYRQTLISNVVTGKVRVA